MNHSDIQKFIDEQIEFCNNFIAKPEEFINKMIQFMNEGKNHSDLAKELNAQEETVEFLVKTIQENHKELLKDITNLSPEIVLNDFNKLDYDLFVNKNNSNGIGIDIYPNDVPNWDWAGASFTALYPVNDPDFTPQHLMSAYSNGWEFYLRPPHKLYCTAETEEEKQEVLQMVYLINKWLWKI